MSELSYSTLHDAAWAAWHDGEHQEWCRDSAWARVMVQGVSSIIREADEQHPIVWSNEHDVQAALEQILAPLAGHGFLVGRECQLSIGGSRIDFLVTPVSQLNRHSSTPLGLGIEVKVKGAARAVQTQLFRYSSAPEVHGLILVSTRPALHATVFDANVDQLIGAGPENSGSAAYGAVWLNGAAL